MPKRMTKAEKFYAESLDQIKRSGIAFLVGGAYAMREYADIWRDTKDLDVFCMPGDYQRLLQALSEAGYETHITSAAWLAKAHKGPYFVDIIFNSANSLCPVDELWFDHAHEVELLGKTVCLIPPEEEIWSKAFVQDRERFDGPDILHIIRKIGSDLDWKRLLNRIDTNWEILFAHLINFRYVYPSERDKVPNWVMKELLQRGSEQLNLPLPEDRICRGSLLSRTQYQIDLDEWGYQWMYKHA